VIASACLGTGAAAALAGRGVAGSVGEARRRHGGRERAHRQQGCAQALDPIALARQLTHLLPAAARDERGADGARIRAGEPNVSKGRRRFGAPALCRLVDAPQRICFAAQRTGVALRAKPGRPWTCARIRLELRSRVNPVAIARLRCDDSFMPSVLIVDDHPAFRASARRLLERDGFDVVGEAPDGASGIELARELDPDLVLLDVVLPDTTGFDVAEELRASRSEVVLVSSRQPPDLGPRLRKAPALGFIPKDELTSEAVRALLDQAA